ncbi:extracellular solute-binding protein [Streptomyces sp. HNM0574]|uniref:ABC transporter substrate-binding protein n=1 Tax=Streptomyces sp. HNM0574 TaxID=2714954 RepID=UPI00146AEB25|nr:extracellular solute-binding protein [Streptomyces sp. HNM0574]NLU67571.1 extracellular solute-binding protein [Streptomyces sp. HNM0574]
MRRRRFLGAALAAGVTGGCADGGDGRTLDFLSLAWQRETVAVTRALVAAWNRENPHRRVRYVQGSWDTVHDQLLTSFEGGEAPDVIHDEAADLTDFAHGGYLTDLTGLLPAPLRRQIPEATWDMTRIAGGIHGVPLLQEPRVLIANRELLERGGVRVPDVQHPWSWEEFEDAAKELTRAGTYGVAWSMNEPVNQSVNLALTTGGRVLRREDGRAVVRFGPEESRVPELIRRQVNTDRTAPRGGLSMGGAETLPGFFAGRYALLPLNFSFRRQVRQQAPDGFGWLTLPLPSGDPAAGGGPEQGVSPQTLSVARDTAHPRTAVDFIAYLAAPDRMARLARADRLLPTSRAALRDPGLATEGDGGRTGLALAAHLRASPVLGVRGYPEWSDKAATPALQQYYGGAIGLRELRERLVTDGNRILARYRR